jgi:hypothetical protein
VVVAGLGDSGLLTAIRLARSADVVGISAKPALVAATQSIYSLESHTTSTASGDVTNWVLAEDADSAWTPAVSSLGMTSTDELVDANVLDRGQPCDPLWNVDIPGLTGSDEPLILDFVMFDDGSGRALYAAGEFSTAGGVAVNNITKWDGSSWSSLGPGLQGTVRTLVVFDDGSGPALYAGGTFTQADGSPGNYIAKWDGSAWSPLDSGVSGGGALTGVTALIVFDDGSGPALYAGGTFTQAGGIPARNIARWDGTSWSALGSGVNGFVAALTVFDDGSGPAIYAGGGFTSAGDLEADRVARWDGSAWSVLIGPDGVGSGNTFSQCSALAVYDDGDGPALYGVGRGLFGC